jgi:Uma2 family endonuclease
MFYWDIVMPLLVNDAGLEEELIADRRARGIDGFDEVWDGVYVMAPLANDEHQEIVAGFVALLVNVVKLTGLGEVRPGANISNLRSDWTRNFRVPDVLVFLKGTAAENRDSHWVGGPDFAIEIVSPGDQSREKLAFYSEVGVRELLIIDRDPWQLELFRLEAGVLKSAAIATVENAVQIQSQIVPITMSLIPQQPRPGILVQPRNGQAWTI